MKGTEHFKRTIKEYLDGKARTDELFAVSYAKENKNLDDCITFILNQVKASGCCGMTDDEVWSLAIITMMKTTSTWATPSVVASWSITIYPNLVITYVPQGKYYQKIIA